MVPPFFDADGCVKENYSMMVMRRNEISVIVNGSRDMKSIGGIRSFFLTS
jgi:hypothetical protein